MKVTYSVNMMEDFEVDFIVYEGKNHKFLGSLYYINHKHSYRHTLQTFGLKQKDVNKLTESLEKLNDKGPDDIPYFVESLELCFSALEKRHIEIYSIDIAGTKEQIQKYKLHQKLGNKKYKQYMYLKDIRWK